MSPTRTPISDELTAQNIFFENAFELEGRPFTFVVDQIEFKPPADPEALFAGRTWPEQRDVFWGKITGVHVRLRRDEDPKIFLKISFASVMIRDELTQRRSRFEMRERSVSGLSLKPHSRDPNWKLEFAPSSWQDLNQGQKTELGFLSGRLLLGYHLVR